MCLGYWLHRRLSIAFEQATRRPVILHALARRSFIGQSGLEVHILHQTRIELCLLRSLQRIGTAALGLLRRLLYAQWLRDVPYAVTQAFMSPSSASTSAFRGG